MLFRKRYKAIVLNFCLAITGICLGVGGCDSKDSEKQDAQSIQQTTIAQEKSETVEELFATEEADTCDMEAVLENVRPTAVQLYYEMPDGGHIAACGFLMEMTDDSIYICTNRHVIDGYEDWQVYFFDGSKAIGHNLGVSDCYDVGVVTVALEQVPQEVCAKLQTVSIDLDAWKEIGNKQPDIGFVRVGQNGEVMYTRTGKVLRILTDFLWGNGAKETEISMEQTNGDSGSAIFDQNGYLISMVHGNSSDAGGERNWGIPLDGLILEYEKITGRTLLCND